MQKSRTQVVIIGGGPAGLMLGQLLQRAGIGNVILENRSGDHVLSRIRAGVLEPRTVETLRDAGVGARADAEGLVRTGHHLMWDDQHVRIPFDLAGKSVLVYGQTKITEDLMEARAANGGITHYEASRVQPHDVSGDHPCVTYEHSGQRFQIDCDYIAGCDGFHGVSRATIPTDRITTHEFAFPFGWLGILTDTPPVSQEVAWVNHPDGFVMCSLRSMTRSRYYFQVPIDEDIKAWDEDRFWAEFRRRMPPELSEGLVTGPALDMSIAPLRSFIAEPMQFGRMFLVGDAAHVVPPTGAKGLNMAIADAEALFDALAERYASGRTDLLDGYSSTALDRVWKAVRFSWWMTNLMHKLSDGPFERRLQVAELDYIAGSTAAQTTIAENFCGLE
jgi:p-hydroxybenzoate 3-monooxygenase